ncbi:hypothetical protein [Burkholderia multivorans]|uniref:hypothetical protein n=1 Tax=Burkholderia multivorans TaxID=87883 RepID=UPI001C25CE18|nr:hypothetical protein [Burkholderia multivorans]MBU9525012.1 hypothetical protein [Burkholderia multivorans]
MNSKLTADQDTLLEKFHVLIDDYARASRNGSTDERVNARLALANAYGALLAPTQQPSGEVTEADLLALLPGTYYMDPPDGGDVSLLEQLRRMAADAGRYRWLRYADLDALAAANWGTGEVYEGEAFDAAIDAARAQGGES